MSIKAVDKKGYKKTPLLNSVNPDDMMSVDSCLFNVSEERTVFPFPESDEYVQQANEDAKFPPNIVVTTRYSVLTFFPKSLFEQFRRLANVYFLVLGCIATVGTYTEYFDTAVEPAGLLIPLTVVVLISIAKDGIEDAKRHSSDNLTNNKKTHIVLGNVRNVHCLYV